MVLGNASYGSTGEEGSLTLNLSATEDGGFDVIVRPTSLLATAWLQFIDAIRSDASCKDCPPPCGRSFVLMPGDYTNKRYCRATCKATGVATR